MATLALHNLTHGLYCTQGSDIIQAHDSGRRLLRSAMLRIGEDPFGPGPRPLRLALPNSRGESLEHCSCKYYPGVSQLKWGKSRDTSSMPQ